MSVDIEEGDYLGSYQCFFNNFISNLNPDDQLPVKMCGYDVTEGEIVGEVIDMTLQYLNQKFCPPSLQSHMVQLVIDEVKSICRTQPEDCGLKPYENTFAPLKLMQAVISKINQICFRYLDNSRLALLPPPPSTPLPLTTCYAIKNTRRKMEDRSVVLYDLNTMFSIKDDSIVNYYAVFDGHSGQDAAVYCAAHLHQYLVESPHYPKDPENALKDAFLTTDARFIKKNINSGSTAVCALLVNKTLYIAWAGDSQAALIKDGNSIQLVNPHKPNREDEMKRIEKEGGCVIHYGVWRVNGHLNVSRSIGDKQYKPCISSEPEILKVPFDGSEDFLIIACDGFWDCIDEKKAAAILYDLIETNSQNYTKASHYLVEVAKNLQSQDNISVIVVFLTHPTDIEAKLKNNRSSLALRMDPNSPQDVQQSTNFNPMDNTGSYPFDMNFGPRDDNSENIHAVDMGCCPFEMNFSKQQQQQNHQTNGSLHIDNENFNYDNSTNGKHENGSAKYKEENDDDDDDDDDDESDEDLGPETDVDAVDNASVPFEKISRELFPEKSQSENDNLQKEDNLDDSQNSTDSKSRQNELLPEADNVADSEDSEDEWNYYRVEPDKDKDSPVQVNETSNESKEKEASPKPLIEDDSENDEESHSKIETEPKSQSSEFLNTECSEKELIIEKEDFEEDKMDFSLNPDAKEFIPPSMFSQRQIIQDFPVAGSPLKQTPQVMDNIDIPSEEEFEKGVSARPRDIDGAASPLSKPLESCLDESEISSTKAEFGDESTTSFLTSEFQRNEVSAMDYSFADSERGDYDIAKDPMAMSFTPSDLQAAFERDEDHVDLNAVHDLTDVDFSDNVNGFENNDNDNDEKKEISPPFVEESEAQASLNPFNMETLRETLNEENMKSVNYSATSTDNVDDICLIDTKVPFTEDSRKISECENNSQYRDYPIETNNQFDDHSESSNIDSSQNDVEEKILENKNIFPHENLLVKEENHFETIESHFDNENLETKEEILENKETLSINEEIPQVIKNESLDNKEIQEKEIFIEKKEENLIETPDFEGEIHDIEFDPEIQEKSQTLFELSLDEEHLQNDVGKFPDEKLIENNDFEQKTNYPPILNLSESLQEFTGLEREINEIKENIVTESEIPKESIIVEQKESINIESLKIEETKNEIVAAITGTVVTAAAVTVAKKTVAPISKTKTSTKAPVKSLPTSPTKTARSSATTAATAAKKSTISRPKQLDTKPMTNIGSKTSGTFKAAPVPKTSTTAPKITPRLTTTTTTTTATTAAKPKTLVSSSKTTSLAAGDKKSTLNGDVKSLTKSTVPKTTTTKPSTVTKTTLVKSSSTTRTSTATAASLKPKSTATSTAAKISSTAPRTATATTRPKTAPATIGASVGTTKPRVSAVKSTIIDKQIKETANKQISSRVNSAPLKTSRSSGATTVTATSTVKRTSTLKTATSPTKKVSSAPLTKTTTTTTKSSSVAKTNGKAITKNVKPIVQNGNCVIKKIESVTTTTTTTTNNIEEDVPKKDISPIASPTDNQLLITE
ncbi:FK506-binding protein 5-like [Leptopilina boulardi]|uniref:FK506-binding protein 5-like n=1 Tax=Leptopilina boulardi TaxID=63433 RepID=UPI0021F67159|nr:FK506-binding protein 5-like [Leptopilina boulardi]